MRFSVFALTALTAAMVLPSVAMASSFQSTLKTTSMHMSDLSTALDAVKAAAEACGNSAVVSSCESAKAHLSTASLAWDSLGSSSSVLSAPWTAGSTSQASQVQSSLANCGSILGAMQGQISSYKESSSDLWNAWSGCQPHYRNCQSGVTTLCSWPPQEPTTTTQPWGPSQTSKPGYGGGWNGGGWNGGGWNGGGWNGGGWKRHNQRRSIKSEMDEINCPGSEVACPISAGSDSVECVDTSGELTSCGGCASIGEGEDCTAVEGAAGVGCSSGSCVVLSCAAGYRLNDFGRCSPMLVKQIAWA